MSLFVYVIALSVGFFLLAVWFWCLVQIIGRPDMRAWEKVIWGVGILVLPILGAAAYLITAGRRGPVDETAAWADKSAEEIEEAAYHASNMTATDRVGNKRIY